MSNWSATQYDLYTDARKRPGLDLIAQIPPNTYNTIADLGCGTGFLTTALKERFPNSTITAIDSSEQMLAQARELDPHIDWQQGDIATLQLTNIDLLFSNATLHWLDDHDTLFLQLLSCLNSGGVFAFQLPNNFNAPSHQLILETIQSGPWCDKLLPAWRDEPTHDATFYYDLLTPQCQHINLWETTYYQILEGEHPVVEWTKGTWLRRFLALLEEDEQVRFLQKYRELVNVAYPIQANGKTLFPFKRLSMVGKIK
ncbi:MAG: trans-aconitate 2-methyltransferase [Coxiella sp. (in: Bacteria)]|nr:MAG: trans-aconitate 2-methyltransferase [Coxiella sp. (in: g-proteobacteria)]